MALLAVLIVPLLLLVAVPHELAHLILARRFGVTVLEFGLGLPPRAWSCHWRGIRWSINWLLPLGAFVKLKGEHSGDAHDDFAALPPLKRALVVAAGPMANLVIAFAAVAISLYFVGVPTGLNEATGHIGYRGAHDPLDALAGLLDRAAVRTGATPTPLLGWVGVAQVMNELQSAAIPPLAWFLALLATLSIGIGVTNLLPLPPLDGGRLAFSVLEAISGRRLVQQQWATRLNLVGIVLLVGAFLAITGADVVRLLSGQHLVR